MIMSVGGVAIQPRHRLLCHCGAVELEVHLPVIDGVNHASDRKPSGSTPPSR